MKKLGLLAILVLGFSLFSTVAIAQASTIVTGKIYGPPDGTTPIGGANVKVTCNNIVKTTASAGDGGYAVQYSITECNEGSTVYVTAEKKGIGSGSESGTVRNYGVSVNIALVNVAIPEFGIIAGMITLLVSGIGFAIIRRRGLLKATI